MSPEVHVSSADGQPPCGLRVVLMSHASLKSSTRLFRLMAKKACPTLILSIIKEVWLVTTEDEDEDDDDDDDDSTAEPLALKSKRFSLSPLC